MADYVYVGRTRHRVRIAIYQFLTLGIYGRVWMYKLLREFDGHEALFLDRRQYLPLLILPIVGPFFVRRRIARLAQDLIQHDVTTPAYAARRSVWLGVIPFAPFFILPTQRVINHHWKMHTKAEELELKKARLEQLQRKKSVEAQAEIKALTKEVAQREKELADVRTAALALKEAEAIRRRAERESGIRRSPLAALKKIAQLSPLKRRRAAAADEEPDEGPGSEPEAPLEPQEAPEPEPKPSRGKKPMDASPREDAAPQEAPGEEEAAETKKAGLFGRFFARRKPAEPEDAKPSPKKGAKALKAKPAASSPDEPLSKDDIKEIRRKAKEERKAAKIAAKEEKQKAKEKAKADKQKAKERKKADKIARKEAKRKAKEQAKEEKRKAKEAKKAARQREKDKAEASKTAAKKKGAAPDKKEKPKPKKKSK